MLISLKATFVSSFVHSFDGRMNFRSVFVPTNTFHNSILSSSVIITKILSLTAVLYGPCSLSSAFSYCSTTTKTFWMALILFPFLVDALAMWNVMFVLQIIRCQLRSSKRTRVLFCFTTKCYRHNIQLTKVLIRMENRTPFEDYIYQTWNTELKTMLVKMQRVNKFYHHWSNQSLKIVFK